MKRSVMYVTFSICLICAIFITGSLQAAASKQSQFLRTSQRYLENLTVPDGVSSDQKMLLAVSVAAAEMDMSDSPELPALMKQLSPNVVYVMTSDTSYTWESPDWVGADRGTYTYNSHNLLTQHVNQTNTGSVWTNQLKVDMTYDGSWRLSTSVTQSWSGSAWANQSQQTITYNGSSQMYQVLAKAWVGGAWVNSTLSTYTYSSGRASEVITQKWQSSAWVNQTRTTYEYNGDGNLTIWTMYSWATSAWVASMRFTYTYDGLLESESLVEMWSGGVWENVSKSVYTYDGTNEVLEVSYLWEVSDWMESDVDTMKWDGDLMIEDVHLDLISMMLYHTLFYYDGHGNEIENVYQRFDDPDWTNETRNVYVYAAGLAVAIENQPLPSVFELKQNYPNPFNPVTAIRYSLHRPSQVDIVVFNVLGQEVRTLESGIQSAGTYETGWDGTDQAGVKVASGIYFYRIKAGDFTETRKMVLLK
jgi:hypothetical protein